MLFFAGAGLADFICFAGQAIRENKKAWHPKADEDAEAFAVCAIFAGGGEPSYDGCHNRDKSQIETNVGDQFQVLFVVSAADGFQVFFNFRGFHRPKRTTNLLLPQWLCLLDIRGIHGNRTPAMKKILVALFLVLVIAGASVWYVVSRYGVTDSASLVPADAVAYTAIPDLIQSGIRWNQTALAKIGMEPSMIEFMERPMGLLGQGGMDEAIGILTRLKPGRIYAALNTVTETSATGIFGFQYFGAKKDYDEAIDRFHRQILQLAPGAARTELTHAGDGIVQIQLGQQSLFTGSHRSWAFVSNDLVTIQNAMDRASGRVSGEALADSEQFQAVRSELSKSAEWIWYVATAPILDVLLAAGEKVDAAVNHSQLEQVRKISAVGGSLSFSGLDQVERIFMLWDDVPTYPAIDRSGLEFTTAQDIVFMESIQDWSMLATPEYLASLPPEITTFLEQNGIDLSKLPAIFGQESVLVANWPSGAMFPTAMMALSIQDRPAMESITRQLVENFAPTATISERHGATVFDFPIPGFSLVDPAVAVSDSHWIAAVTGSALNGVLDRTSSKETLAASPAFQSVSAQWQKDSQSFLFVDTKTVFERIYNTARPMIIFGAAMSPDLAKSVDIQKLPETEIISKHLGPMVMTQHTTSNGWLIESSGPITLYQTITLGGAAVGISAAANLWMQNR